MVEIVVCVGFLVLLCWCCIDCLMCDGVIWGWIVFVDWCKFGFNVYIFVQVCLNVYGCVNFDEFGVVICGFFEVFDVYVMMGMMDFFLCIVMYDIDVYE